MSAHTLHMFFENSLSLDMYWPASVQISAQSRLSWMHLASIFTLSSLRQAVAQASHDSAQSKHASIQL
jgi:uncharacterized membrane protein